MLTINFEPFPVITTERLVLRQFTKYDLPEIFRLRSDERVGKYLVRPAITNMGEADAFITKILNGIANKEWITWGITMKGFDKARPNGEAGRIMGTICLWNISKENYRAEVGFDLHPDFWRKGIMQEALVAVLEYGFNTMKLHSIEGVVNPDNIPSIKLLEKNRFEREAYFRENFYHNGKFLNTAIYSLVG